MLKTRLITVLSFNQGVLFRTKKFVPDYRYTSNFVDAWSVDEIVLLDISRDPGQERAAFEEVVSNFAARCFVPLSAGGGVRTMQDIERLLKLGADKVVINTAAVHNPGFVSEAANRYGAQCIIASIDAKQGDSGSYEVFTGCGRVATGMAPASCAKMLENAGAGEILVTSMDRDGSLDGYDNILNRQVSEAVTIPVLGCGGAGKWQDFVDGLREGKLSAVCTANIFHFTETSIRSAKNFLKNAGIEVRM